MAIKIPTRNARSVEEIAAEIYKQEQVEVENTLPNRVLVRVESASGNLMDGKNAAGVGLIYGRITRVMKGESILFESSDGELHERSLKKCINGQFSMNIGAAEARTFVNKFHQLRPEQTGARRCEVEFCFGEEVFVNSNATISAEGCIIGDLKAPQGQAIGSADEFDKLFAEKTQASIDYRRNRRAELNALALQQLEATNSDEESSDTPVTEEVADLNTI